MNVFRPLVLLNYREMERYYHNMAAKGWILKQSTAALDSFARQEPQERYYLVMPEQGRFTGQPECRERVKCLGSHKWFQVCELEDQGEVADYEVPEDLRKKLWMQGAGGFLALPAAFAIIVATQVFAEPASGAGSIAWRFLFVGTAALDLLGWCVGIWRRIRELGRKKPEQRARAEKSYPTFALLQQLLMVNHLLLAWSLVMAV